jgi:hypothetical protein
MNTPPELMHFLALSHEEQAAAIRNLAAQGWSDYGIAGATRLSVEQVRRIRRTSASVIEPMEVRYGV